MTKQRSHNINLFFLGVLLVGMVGFVVYQRSRPLPRLTDENKAFNDKQWQPILLAEGDIEKAIKAYKGEHGEYPASLNDLHLTNFPSGVSTSYLAYIQYSKVESGYNVAADMGAIGARASAGNHFRAIDKVIPNSPAARANLKRGDVVLRVDGKDVTQGSVWDYLAVIEGAPGTTVKLTVWKQSSGTNETVTLTRATYSSFSGH
jgi:predicted metalloprotease with PDZ domain